MAKDACAFGKVRNPRRAGSLERDEPLSLHTNPWSPARKWTVGSTSGRKGKRGSVREAGLKVAEENALEGRTPRRARFGDNRLRADVSVPFPGRSQPLESRPLTFRRGRGNDRRGEALRGAPPAGRSKALKGEPHGRCGGRRAVTRRGGEKTVERVVKP